MSSVINYWTEARQHGIYLFTSKIMHWCLHTEMSNKVPSTGKIEKRFFFSLWKHIKCSRIHRHYAREIWKGNNYFGFVFERKLGQGNAWLSRRQRFSKCFPCTIKRKVLVFKFLGFEERFKKTPCSWRTSMNGRPNRGNKRCVFKFLWHSLDEA